MVGTPRTQPIARAARSALALLGSGVLGAAGLVLLARGWLPGIAADVGSTLVLFIQWEVMMLTAAKFGVDQLVFALVTADARRRPQLWPHIARRTIPIALVTGVAMASVFGPVAALAGVVATVADTHAVCRMAELSGRRRLREFSVGNILNYPLFFLLIAVGPWEGRISLEAAAWCFCVSSLARWAWVASRAPAPEATEPYQVAAPAALGTQQVLNYVAFRGDQLVLPLISFALFAEATTVGRSEYVYLARFPELVAAVLVTLAPLYLPSAYRTCWSHRASERHRGKVTLLAVALAVMVGGVAFRAMGATASAPVLLAMFIAAAALGLPANLVTYALMREERLDRLTRALVFGVLAGGAVAGCSVLAHQVIVLAAAVPAALATYVVLGWHSVTGSTAA